MSTIGSKAWPGRRRNTCNDPEVGRAGCSKQPLGARVEGERRKVTSPGRACILPELPSLPDWACSPSPLPPGAGLPTSVWVGPFIISLRGGILPEGASQPGSSWCLAQVRYCPPFSSELGSWGGGRASRWWALTSVGEGYLFPQPRAPYISLPRVTIPWPRHGAGTLSP